MSETEQLEACDGWKVDPDDKPYQRMMSHARDMERQRDEWKAVAAKQAALHDEAAQNVDAYRKHSVDCVVDLRKLQDAVRKIASLSQPSDPISLLNAIEDAERLLPENVSVETRELKAARRENEKDGNHE